MLIVLMLAAMLLGVAGFVVSAIAFRKKDVVSGYVCCVMTLLSWLALYGLDLVDRATWP